MKDQDWDLIDKVHVYGAYRVRCGPLFEYVEYKEDRPKLTAIFSYIVCQSCLATFQKTKVWPRYQYHLILRSLRQLRPGKLFWYAFSLRPQNQHFSLVHMLSCLY